MDKHFTTGNNHKLELCSHKAEAWSVVPPQPYRICDCCEGEFHDYHLTCRDCPMGGFDICPECAENIDGNRSLKEIRHSEIKCPYCRQLMTIGAGGDICCQPRAYDNDTAYSGETSGSSSPEATD